jgi:8-amino-7-oxononanoate synthase
VAVLSGSDAMVRLYQDRSETRVHCSPPSIPVIRAAETALTVNERYGDALRSRLAYLVRYFRERLRVAGLSASGGLFPLQTLAVMPGVDVARLYDQLRRAGIRSVLHRSRGRRRPAISFLLTVRHAPRDISHAVETLASAARGRSTGKSEEKGYASFA